jgi:hypothetical protein
MTTPNGAIVFHATSGSDTQASGLGPSTAVYGSGASTDGTAVVTGITTTGVSAGDLLWVQTASGRQFSIIASVDSSTQVTCDDTFALGASQTWAIGGKRATLDNSDSRLLFTADAKPGWTIETETDQSLTSAIAWTADGDSTGCITLKGSDATTLKKINQTANANGITLTIANYVAIKDLHIVRSSGSNGYTAIAARGIPMVFENVKIDNSGGNSWNHGITRNGGNPVITMLRVVVTNCVLDGISDAGGGVGGVVSDSIFANNGGDGVAAGIYALTLSRCLIYGNGAYGVVSSQYQINVSNCVIHGNTSDGINLSGVANSVVGCVLSGNGGYGINVDSSWALGSVEDFNAFYNNTTGEVNNITKGPSDVTLTADPFTDTATDDYTINTTAGGGSTLRSTAITLGSTETRPFRWLDAAAAGVAAVFSYMANFTRLG